MKYITTVLIFLIICQCQAFCQDSFDGKLQELAEKVAIQISQKGKAKVAVWHFVNTQGEITDMGKFIAEDFSVYFTNASKGVYQVMDRNHLDQILREHKLNAEGFIDPETAKQLGRLNAVDAIITGTVDILDPQLKVRVKVLDSETALQIAAEIGYLPVDANISSFLGVPGLGSNGQTESSANRGFNRPLNSNEQINNPETVNKECESTNSGDYCFANQSEIKLFVRLDISTNEFGDVVRLTLEPGQTQCIYNKKASVCRYYIQDNITSNRYIGQGEVLIEKCRSKTFVIK